MSVESGSATGISSAESATASAVAVESGLFVSIESPSANLSAENPFSLPEYRFDPQNISLDTTRRFSELAFNPDLYRPVIENLSAEEKADSSPAISQQQAEIQSIDGDIEDEIAFSPIIPEVDAPEVPSINTQSPEAAADESALKEALATLSTLNLTEEEEEEWTEKMTRAVNSSDPKVDQAPAPSLAYDLAFGEVEPSSVEDIQTNPRVEEEILRTVNETEELSETEDEVEMEVKDEDLKKKIIRIPEDSWDRYEIVERDETAQDVQKRRVKTAERAVHSSINPEGEIDTEQLRMELNRLDDQTADEKLRIADDTLEMPEIADQAKASVTDSLTHDQALGEIRKVVEQNEAENHIREVTSRQTLPFDKLDRGAQEVILNLEADKVIRPLVWEKADKLPLKNPVEIERSKAA